MIIPNTYDLGLCFKEQGQSGQAAECFRQGLAMAEQLEQDKSVKQKRGALQGN